MRLTSGQEAAFLTVAGNAPALLPVSLEHSPDQLTRSDILVQCPSQRSTSGKVSLSFGKQSTSKLDLNLLQISSDATQLSGEAEFYLLDPQLDSVARVIPPETPDGDYQIQIASIPVFSGLVEGSAPILTTCQLRMDRTAPALGFKFEKLATIDDRSVFAKSTYTVKPGQAVDISARDTSDTEISVCLAEQQEGAENPVLCNAGWQTLGGPFYAPDRGIWTLFVRATDQAGNTSIDELSIAVYHDDLIGKILAQGDAIKNLLYLNKTYEAVPRMIALLKNYNLLPLELEKKAVLHSIQYSLSSLTKYARELQRYDYDYEAFQVDLLTYSPGGAYLLARFSSGQQVARIFSGGEEYLNIPRFNSLLGFTEDDIRYQAHTENLREQEITRIDLATLNKTILFKIAGTESLQLPNFAAVLPSRRRYRA